MASNMMAFSRPANIASLLLFLKVAFVFQLPVVITARATNPLSSSYQPTTGIEERWVAEEEFHGASSWWDDDGDDDHESADERMLQSASPATYIKEGKNVPVSKKHRLRVWKNSKTRKESPPSTLSDDSLAESPTKGTMPDNSPLTSDYDEEHPMRTDEWQLDVQLSRLFPKEEGEMFPECYIDRTDQTKKHSTSGSYRKRQVMQFARNGYVKILDEGSSNTATTGKKQKPKVGKWRIGHSGVAFDIPVQVNVKRKKGSKNDNNDDKLLSRMTVLHYHADIHLNKFGERPRMFKGVITRDR